MAMRESLITRETARRVLGLGVVGALGYSSLVGCGSNNENATPDAHATTTVEAPRVVPTDGATTGLGSRPGMLTFDDLGGGSPLIKVYFGPGESVADKRSTGAYNDDETVRGICKTEGRAVTSDTSAGEAPRTSEAWIQIESSAPDVPQYATAVYVENPATLLGQLKNCPTS